MGRGIGGDVLVSAGEYLLGNWADWLDMSGADCSGYGQSSIAGLIKPEGVRRSARIDVVKAQQVEDFLNGLASSAPIYRQLAVKWYVENRHGRPASFVAGLLDIGERNFFAKRKELQLMVNSAINFSGGVDTAQRIA